MIVTLPHYFPRGFQFSNSDVAVNLLKQRKRRANLFTAVSLHSLYASKCCVWVAGEDQCIALYGQVLAFSDRQVIMEGGIAIPTSAVCKVEFPDRREYLS